MSLARTAAADPASASALGRAGPGEIVFEDACATFGSFLAMGPTSIRVRAGEFIAIVGPSGCGKSTFLNLIAGTLRPSSGRVLYNGAPVEGANRDVGYITQKNYCLPWRTVEANIRLPLEFRKLPRHEIDVLVTRAVKQVGLQGFERAYPRQLSGGMLQRVMIARTLAYNPATYLMDEPFGSLDAQLRTRMHAELLRLWQETGSTFVFVTHDLHEAITLADRVVVISRRPGRIKLIVDIALSRPRDVIDIHSSPEFGAYFKTLWNSLDVH
jgi:ABC-type nitrate/sulfonate/bicarbonate transport system ATPase subunit